MSSRLLLKLAGPVPSLNKRAASVRLLLNTSRYPLKTRAIDTRRRIILRRIHRPSKIRRGTQTQKPCYSITQCIRAAFALVSFPAPLPQRWLPPAKDGSGTFRRISWSCLISITRILVGQSDCSKILYYNNV